MPDAGCSYIDLGGLYRVTGEQLEFDAEFADAGLLALLGMGSSPGKTNVMAVRAVRELGSEPERLDVIAAGRDLDPPDGPSYPYSPQTLVDEMTMEPMAVRDGRPVALEPMSDGGARRLPGADRPRRDHLHAALRDPHVRRELRLHRVELPPVAVPRGAGARPGPGGRVGGGGGRRGCGRGALLPPHRVGRT